MNIKQYWYVWLSVVVLLLALPQQPESYYEVLRWIVAASAAYTAYGAYHKKEMGWAWVFAVITVLFNPIFPMPLLRESWMAFDVIAIGFFGWYAIKAK